MFPWLGLLLTAHQTTPVIKIDSAKPGISVSKSLYGIFFEEINFAGDGGIHSELIRNRGFEEGKDGAAPAFWHSVGATITLDKTVPFNDGKARSLKISPGESNARVTNDGFWGVPMKAGSKHKLVVWARADKPASLAVSAVGLNKTPSSTVSILPVGTAWKRHEVVITALKTDPKSVLNLLLSGKTNVWLGYVSLTPVEGWGTKNFIRKDLGEKVAAMKPGFVRFPGGCFVEGNNLAQAFDWKTSLGAPETRPGNGRRFWGYGSTDGLGYHEYLQWCEDLGAEPLFVANCGMSHSEIAPLDQMDKFTQDALDAIEYANGPTTSPWGAKRAANGHPKPFNLKYVEIGNENGASWSFGGPPPYAERYLVLYRAIKAKYPRIITIADNPVPHPMEVIDEHYYNNPAFFWQNANRYDKYDRKGPKIYVGEYAVTQECGKGNLQAGLAEAAFMTGMERNSDIVTMSSYAPLFVNDNARQWNPDAIVFNNHQSYGTPSYWVQQLFSANRPARIVPTQFNIPTPPVKPAGGIGLMTWGTSSEFKDIRLTSDGKTLYDSAAKIGAWKNATGKWSVSDGVIKQTSLDDDVRTYLNNVKVDGLTSYTLSLKARKLSGREGFLVILNAQSESNRLQWNLGGWRNTEHGFESGGRVTPGVKGSIEANRWYQVRLEVNGPKVSGYLDDKLIETITLKPTPKFAAVSGLSDDGKTLIVKVVNGDDNAVDADLNLGDFRGLAEVTTLTGPNMLGENSFQSPMAIAPRVSQWAGTKYRFQPRSLTILRVRRK